MELGEKLKHLRQEAGLSQRQLCGDVITRNMLSQIEHGSARPSMDTLRYLAGQLGKPVSYFLEEDVLVSRNQERIAQARLRFQAEDWQHTWNLLDAFEEPDAVFEGERNYLRFCAALGLARQAMEENRNILAREWLEKAENIKTDVPGLQRERLLLAGRLPGADLETVVGELPCLDEELLLRAEAALKRGDTQRAETLLAAADNRDCPRWNLLMGRTLTWVKRYPEATVCLQKAEDTFDEICWPLLEICFRELGDYQKAYLYACKRR